VWYFMETAKPPRDATWAPLLIGVLAGLGSRLLGGSAPSSILNGALTAAIAIGAMVAARQGITYAITQQSEQNQVPVRQDIELGARERQETEEALDESEDGAETPMVLEPADPSRIPTAPSAAQKVAMGGQQTLMFAAYFAVGALMAYFLGKGKGTCCAAPAASAPPPPANEPPHA
jgi:hypothetical protein